MSKSFLLALAVSAGLCSFTPALAQSGTPVIAADPSKGIAYLETAVTSGDIAAAARLGRILLIGVEAPRDADRAMGLLTSAAGVGEPNAQMFLADVWIRGQYDVPADPAKGKDMLERAAATRPEAQLKLAEYLLDDRYGMADPTRAKTVLENLIEQGNSRAMFVLGNALLRGDTPGIVQDQVAGTRLFARAMAAGNPEAMRRLGEYLLAGTMVPKDEQRGLDLLAEASAAGDSGAKYRLGVYYFTATPEKPADIDKALGYLDMAIAANNPEAKSYLGDQLLRGTALTGDVDRGLTLLEEAASSGFLRAKVIMGQFYLRRGDNGDDTRGTAWLEEAIEDGLSEAMLALGEALVRGVDLPADIDRGMALLEQAAELGNARANYVLGDIYLRGLYSQRKIPEKGLELLQTASAGGFVAADRVLGEELIKGENLSQDSDRGLKLLRTAAEAGDSRAAFRLGDIYLRRADATPADIETGLSWLRQATAAGDRDATGLLGDWLIKHATTEQERIEAVSLLSDAAASGNVQSAYLLGAAYFEGRYQVSQDRVAGLALLEQAARGGQGWANIRLANAHLRGELGQPDPAKAEALFRRALELGTDYAVVPLAGLYFSGTMSGRKDNAAALTLLDAEARSGNVIAIQQLLAIYGDGRWDVTDAQPARWQEYQALLEQYGNIAQIGAEAIVTSLRERSGADLFRQAAASMDDLPPELQQSVVTRLLRVNPNGYVYIIQDRLSARGLYSGPINGLLTTPTISAINEACRTLGSSGQCDVPLSVSTATYLIANL